MAIETRTTASNLLKDTFSEIKELTPVQNVIQKNLQFKKVDEFEGQYIVRLRTVLPQGYTLHEPGSDMALNASDTPTNARLVIDVPGVSMRGQISKELVNRYNATKLGPKAFAEKAKQNTLTPMLTSHSTMIESLYVYGRATKGFGEVSAVATSTVTITAAEFAIGLWTSRKNALFTFWNAAGTVKRVDARLVSWNQNNLALPTLTFNVDLAAAGVVATDIIRPFNSALTSGKEPIGFHNTMFEATNYYGLTLANEPLMLPTTKSGAAGPLSYDLVSEVANKACANSTDGSENKYVLLCSPHAAQQLIKSAQGKQAYDYSYDQQKATLGFKKTVIQCGQALVMPMPHYMFKDGYAVGIRNQDWELVGPANGIDLSSNIDPNDGTDKGVFFPMSDHHAYECRSYSGNAPVCHQLAAQFGIYDLKNY